ncbi:VOC family protein [Enterococcus hermanniensis]|uniref:Lactoylglutathione lyase n=1 Tax=Enterococcus hermanniensis TaxID=249189 RepID=A0A1L8TQP7_9ENTE|nr:VOC family protein [Enterococcus hermanniensis]OJG46508.1 lactoylglutathione lyase [Enterococcus hermanniensis]
MKIEHIALYVNDLETNKHFFETYFAAKSNQQYHNPKTGLRTYFLTFSDGARLELMSRPEMTEKEVALFLTGYTHLAFSLGSKKAVDQLTQRLADDGFKIVSGPRTTGDGYYESCILGPENNQIEITA